MAPATNNDAAGLSPKQQAKRDERMQSLVAAGYDTIALVGFEGMRTRDIAAAAGVNIATLHYYFKRKADMIHAIAEHILDEVLAIRSGAPSGPEQDELTVFVESILARFADDPSLFIVLGEISLRSIRDAECAGALKRLDDGLVIHVGGILVRSIESGVYSAQLSPPLAAAIIVSQIKGLSIQAIINPNSFDFASSLRELLRWVVAQA
ncbi:MAG TPA: TetR/AcrR family transcriptional regulator [Capsulimonadaceae bacterium]|jgi:AcrR family transcriptional regulator